MMQGNHVPLTANVVRCTMHAMSEAAQVNVTLRLPEKLHRDLKAEAIADRRSLAGEVEVLLGEALGRRRAQAEIDAGTAPVAS